MYTLYVMVGLPGSGKSTFLNFVDDPEFGDTVFVYSTDRFIEEAAKHFGSTYNKMFNDNIKAATQAMDQKLALAFSMGVDVYWDQTNMSPKKRASILTRTPKSYKKICLCWVPPRNGKESTELYRRLDNRPGKNIPDHVIVSMERSYVEPSVDEGFDEVRLFDIYGNKI